MSHAEIAAELKIPKSSLTQLLKTLVARDWLAQSDDKRGYRLGKAFSRLAKAKGQAGDIVALCQPILSEISNATHESVGLHMLRGTETEVVATVPSSERLNISMRVGDRAPLYALSAGKAILAKLPVEMQEEYFSNVEFLPLTPKAKSSPEQLRIELEVICREGIAYTFEEFTVGCAGMARAIISPAGEVLGAINVATPIVRYDKAKRSAIKEALDNAIHKIEQLISSS
nr:J483 [uncultured bacterium]